MLSHGFLSLVELLPSENQFCLGVQETLYCPSWVDGPTRVWNVLPRPKTVRVLTEQWRPLRRVTSVCPQNYVSLLRDQSTLCLHFIFSNYFKEPSTKLICNIDLEVQ